MRKIKGFQVAVIKYKWQYKNDKKVENNYVQFPIYSGKTYYSYGELKQAIEDYIKYYHEKRIKERLGWRSPVQYSISIIW